VSFGELVDEFSLSLEIRISIFRLRLQFSYPHAIRHFEFPPDICSRVTFVNLTVTRSSLQSQCLNSVLNAERPDIDEKRSNLLKLQGVSFLFFI
jgi:hypothetical protein